MNIITGKRQRAQRVVIYGPEGIGKTTLASQFPSPVFLDTEQGTDQLDVPRLERATSWSGLLKQVEYLCRNAKDYKTIVLDTVDGAESLCRECVCAEGDDKGKAKARIEDFPYGSGYNIMVDKFSAVLDLLTTATERGINVVIVAHCALKKFETPGTIGAYDRYQLRLISGPKADLCARVKDWADMVLFCNYDVNVIQTDDKGKKFTATGGQKRLMFTEHSACWDAKNRHGLDSELPMEFKAIAHCIPVIGSGPAVSEKKEAPLEPTQVTPPAEPDKTLEGLPPALADLIRQDGSVTVADIEAWMVSKGRVPAGTPLASFHPDLLTKIVTNWGAAVTQIHDMKGA